MMDYEVMYQAYQTLGKALREKNANLVKLHKSLSKGMETGDLKQASKDVASIDSVNQDIGKIMQELRSVLDSFDTKAYLAEGWFAAQLLELCRQQQVDVIGDYPNYEMFPFSVRLDADNQDVYIDRKRISCSRPADLVARIQNGRERLMKASFNAAQFANELANAYDLALTDLKKESQSDIYLQKLYTYLVPMSRFRKDYDLQSYAFDLARLFMAGNVTIKDGRSFQFGPSRVTKKAIRILDDQGHEQYLATIRFYR